MKLEVELFCDGDIKKSPPYRIYVNNELMLERDFVVPEELDVSHYNIITNVDLKPNNKNEIKYESIKKIPMHFGKLWVENKEISHSNGKFVL
jgi:hypothetical protein